MTRRRCLIILAVLLVAVAGVGVYALMPPKPGVTLENFMRLYNGMTLKEAESILGDPAHPGESVFPNRVGYHWSVDDAENGSNFALMLICQNDTVVDGWYYWDDPEGHKYALGISGSPPESFLGMCRRRVKEWTGW